MAPKVYISTLTLQDFIHFSILFSISTHKVLMKLYLLSPKLFLLIANAAKLQRLPTLRNAGTLGALEDGSLSQHTSHHLCLQWVQTYKTKLPKYIMTFCKKQITFS